MIILELVGAATVALLIVVGLGFFIVKTRFDNSPSKEDKQ